MKNNFQGYYKMAAIVLMLGSVAAVALAGQVTVKKVEPKPQPEKKTNSSFWAEEVERAREPEPGSAPAPAVSAPAPAPAPAAPVPVPIDCQGDWSEWSACTKPCEGGTQFMSFTQTQAPEHGGVACPNPLKKTRECNTQACPPPPLTDENAEFKGYKPIMTNRKCNNHGKALTNEYLRGDGEEKVASNDVLSWKYQRLLERGIEKCDKDQFCQYVELQHGKSIGRTFKQADCRGMDDTHPEEGVKIWEKKNWVDPYMQDPAHGYEQTGSRNLTCSGNTSGWLKQGYLPKRDGKAPSFTQGGFKNIDTLYGEYLKQGAQICNSDDECKYVSVFLDGIYRTYNADACETNPMSGMADVKTWKKVDPSVAGKAVVDCGGTWSDWTECSKPCNGGTQKRTFTKTREPERGGKACPNPTQTQRCNTQKCPPKDCEGKWSDWGPCSKVCGGGTQSMTFEQTVAPENGGRPCPPTRTRPCNTQACPPPEPPMWKCGGDENAKILFSQLNDNTCDCQPGFDDEPKTGKCDVPKNAVRINAVQVTGDRGTRYLQGRPVIVREDKSGWESQDFDLGSEHGMSTYGGKAPLKYADKCSEKAEELFREHQKTTIGMSVWRSKDNKQYKCRVYTGNNGKATDPACVDAPWLKKSCLSKASFLSDNDDKANQYSGGGLYWKRVLPSDYSARKDEWNPPPPPPSPKPEEKVSTNGKCGTKAKPYKARCPDNFCCTYPYKLCRESGKACSTTGVNEDNAKYHGKRTRFWSGTARAPDKTYTSQELKDKKSPFAGFLPQDNTIYPSTNLKCGTAGSPSPGYCPKGRCCSDKLMNMCVPTNTMQKYCTPGHANRKYDYLGDKKKDWSRI